jgi:hypothetical protein
MGAREIPAAPNSDSGQAVRQDGGSTNSQLQGAWSGLGPGNLGFWLALRGGDFNFRNRTFVGIVDGGWGIMPKAVSGSRRTLGQIITRTARVGLSFRSFLDPRLVGIAFIAMFHAVVQVQV